MECPLDLVQVVPPGGQVYSVLMFTLVFLL